MIEMMRCCVKQPKECGAVIVFTGSVHNWKQVDVPNFGLLSFCPEHDEAAQYALEISNEHARRIDERNARFDRVFGPPWGYRT